MNSISSKASLFQAGSHLYQAPTTFSEQIGGFLSRVCLYYSTNHQSSKCCSLVRKVFYCSTVYHSVACLLCQAASVASVYCGSLHVLFALSLYFLCLFVVLVFCKLLLEPSPSYDPRQLCRCCKCLWFSPVLVAPPSLHRPQPDNRLPSPRPAFPRTFHPHRFYVQILIFQSFVHLHFSMFAGFLGLN